MALNLTSTIKMNTNFHISLPCKNLKKTIEFYSNELFLKQGRGTSKWVDFNLYGNQITFVLVEKFKFNFPHYLLEEDQLPSFHFGVILDVEEWDSMYDRINRWSDDTIVKKTFFKDKNGEQTSFFVKDPNDYYIEFKTFREHGEIFM